MSKVVSAIFTLLFIIFSEKVKLGAKAGIESGIFVLFPAIFPYMVISKIFIKTGGASALSEFTYPLTKKIFRFSPDFSSAYLISLFCGYPTGASLACELEEKNKPEALRMFLFGNVPGFGFCVSFLGGILKNPKSGLILYLCFAASSIILNYIFSFALPMKNVIHKNYSFESLPRAITDSVKESVVSMFYIIGFAVLFSGISELACVFIKSTFLTSLISAFLEITTGIPKFTSLPLIVFFTAFSGISVIFQSVSFKKDTSVILKMLFARLLFAIVSVILFLFVKPLT